MEQIVTYKKQKQLVIDSIVFLLIGIWVYSAVNQLLQFENFRIRMKEAPFIGEYSVFLAPLIPFLETLAALFFFFPGRRLAAFFVSLVLLLFYTVYLLAVLNFADSVPCNCIGINSSISWKQHVLINLGLILFNTSGLWMCMDKRKG